MTTLDGDVHTVNLGKVDMDIEFSQTVSDGTVLFGLGARDDLGPSFQTVNAASGSASQVTPLKVGLGSEGIGGSADGADGDFALLSTGKDNLGVELTYIAKGKVSWHVALKDDTTDSNGDTNDGVAIAGDAVFVSTGAGSPYIKSFRRKDGTPMKTPASIPKKAMIVRASHGNEVLYVENKATWENPDGSGPDLSAIDLADGKSRSGLLYVGSDGTTIKRSGSRITIRSPNGDVWRGKPSSDADPAEFCGHYFYSVAADRLGVYDTTKATSSPVSSISLPDGLGSSDESEDQPDITVVGHTLVATFDQEGGSATALVIEQN